MCVCLCVLSGSINNCAALAPFGAVVPQKNKFKEGKKLNKAIKIKFTCRQYRLHCDIIHCYKKVVIINFSYINNFIIADTCNISVNFYSNTA